MIAVICLVAPSLIIFLAKELLCHNSTQISEKAQEYAGYLVVTNILMIFILYVGFNNYGQLISKLNNSYVFALKYFSLSFVISLLIALIDRAEYKRPDLKQKVKTAIPYVCLIALFIVAGVFLDRNADLMLDSDMSSEMILAKLLSQEKGVLSTEWFYSTELRVLNTQLVFTPLFWFLGDWHIIRVTGTIICWLILLFSYYFLCKQLNINKTFAISAICLLIPISTVYTYIAITGLYYIPHIIITFLTLGLMFHYVKSNHHSNISLIILCLLAIGAGIGGPRQLLILYIPLILTDGILLLTINVTKTRLETPQIKRFITASLLSSFFSVIGYLINSKILSEIYYFKDWGNIKFQNVSIESFMTVVNGILNTLGYQKGEVFSFATISNLFCGFLIILLTVIIYSGIRNRESSNDYYICSLYFLSGIITFVLLYSATNMQYADNYNVPILVFAVPLIVIGIKEIQIPTEFKKVLEMIIAAGLILCCGNNFLSYLNGDAYASSNRGSEYVSIANFLVDEGYTEGYATFWDGNILTELSDGEIDVRVWGSSSAETIDQIYKWLQLKSHVDTVPERSVFVLLRPNQFDKIEFYPLLNEDNIIYETDSHVIYGYADYDSLLDDLEDPEDDIEDKE